MAEALSRRSYTESTQASSWEEIWEAGPYYERISEILESAQSYAVFVGWQIDSRLPLVRPQTEPAGGAPLRETLKEKILRICAEKPHFQFFFLMWDHAYFYIFEREAWQGRVWEDIHPRVHFVFDGKHPLGGSHHEKVCVIDGRVAFCGGIDLCDERWDTPQHHYQDLRRSLNWRGEHHGPYHDLAVQVRGPVCQEIEKHIVARWNQLSSILIPINITLPRVVESNGHGHKVFLSRTLASVDSKPLIREVEFLFRDLIRSAKNQIVLEGQYYWSREVNNLLIKKMREQAGTGFRVAIILAEVRRFKSLVRLMAVHESHLLDELMKAALETGTHLIAGYPYALPPRELPQSKPRPIYVHSKVLIVDDHYLSIGSANFASRALRLDTEINLTLEATHEMDRAHIRKVSQQILEHWNQEGICLMAIHPEKDLRLISPFLRKIPFHWFFDPKLPWFFKMKQRIFRRIRRQNMAGFALGLTYAAIGYVVTLGLLALISPQGSSSPNSNSSMFSYSVLLFSAWILPVPVALTSAFAACTLGSETGSRLVVASIWGAQVWGYLGARVFPNYFENLIDKINPDQHLKKIGQRNFYSLALVLLDPRISFQKKVAYQGLFCIPLPWFALTAGILIPGLLYFVCLIAAKLAPIRWSDEFADRPGIALAFLVLLTVLRRVSQLWKNEK